MVIVALSLLAATSLAAIRPVEASVMGLIAVGAVVTRQLLMPRINDHRDRMIRGNVKVEKSFARLHRLSVWIDGAQLVGAFSVLVLLIMA